jgi:TIR domain-containing protein
MSDIFISYSQPDAECAFELVARLESEGIKCWIAPRDITPAADWAAEIIDAISAARLMVLVFSSSSNDSAQVRREVERAVHKQVHILPFRIEDVLPSKSLEYFLSSQHWMDAFPPPRDMHYARLCQYLKAHVESRVATPGVVAPGVATQSVATAAAAAPLRVSSFQAAQLRPIELHLAQYIGPLARHLVKQAASRATGIEDLISRLSMELDGEAERRDFANRCRQPPESTHG